MRASPFRRGLNILLCLIAYENEKYQSFTYTALFFTGFYYYVCAEIRQISLLRGDEIGQQRGYE